jgi:hypothetical protein
MVNTNDENGGNFWPKSRFPQPGEIKSDRLLVAPLPPPAAAGSPPPTGQPRCPPPHSTTGSTNLRISRSLVLEGSAKMKTLVLRLSLTPHTEL